jgi:class 3 adenylate cyclase
VAPIIETGYARSGQVAIAYQTAGSGPPGEEFVTGEITTGVATGDRILATIPFTDIVESTRRAAGLGDAQWRALLDAHDTVAAEEVARFRGRLVERTGDGILASFDGPARAVQCFRHLAARVMALAGAGELLTTRTVKDLVSGSGLSVQDRGLHSLKGFDQQVQICAVQS